MLSRVREHMTSGSRFIVDVDFKRPQDIVGSTAEEQWYSYVDSQGHQVRVSVVDHFDHVRQIWIQTLVRRWRQDSQLKSAKPVKLILRYFMPQEMETLLHYNGFTILSRYGDWQGEPLSQESYQQIYVCKLSS